MSNIEEWNTSWTDGELPDNMAAPQILDSQESPSPRRPVPIGRDFPVNGEGFRTVNRDKRFPINKEQFRRPKKECRWGSDCRQAQVSNVGLGNDKDKDHIRFFSHPEVINDPPYTVCKNGEDCWALLMRDKALEEKEEVPLESARHCFFFHTPHNGVE